MQNALLFWFGLTAVAVIGHYAIKLDEWQKSRRDADADPRKSSWWVWCVMVLMIGGGLYWMGTNSEPAPRGGQDEDREWYRR